MRVIEADDYSFHFAYDRRRSRELHIELRTGVGIQTAIDAFFNGSHWNARRQRFECYTELYGLYWCWLYGDETLSNVFVISCFPHEEGA